jgi:integrase
VGEGTPAARTTEAHEKRVLAYLREAFKVRRAERLADLDLTGAERWLNERREGDNLGARAVGVRVQALRSFGRWLVESRRVAVNPFAGLRAPNVEAGRRYVRRALTAAEVGRLLDAARSRPLLDGQRRAAREADYRRAHGGKASARGIAAEVTPEAEERFRLQGEERAEVYRVLLATGLRRGEAGRILWTDIDLEGGLLTIRADVSKAGREDVLPVSSDALAALKARRKRYEASPAESVVFPKGTLPTPVSFRRDLKAAGIEHRAKDGTVLDLHALRTTLATHLATSGVPLALAQRIMRHSDPKLTSTTYTRPASTDLRAAIESAAPACLSPACPIPPGERGSLSSPDGVEGGDDEQSDSRENGQRGRVRPRNSRRESEWAQQDSDLRPRACEARALTN